MKDIILKRITLNLYHEYFKGFEYDESIFIDRKDYFHYQYSKEKVDKYYQRQQVDTRVVFMIMQGDQPVGELKLKNINHTLKECTLSIHLQNDDFKGMGIGTSAEKAALEYAFNELNMNVVKADAIKRNKRSQAVLEKVGFRFIKEDKNYRYYMCRRGEIINE